MMRKVKVTLDHKLDIQMCNLASEEILEMTSKLTIKNPKFLEAQRMGFYTGDMEKFLQYYKIDDEYKTLSVPRGFADEFSSIMRKGSQIESDVTDNCTFNKDSQWLFPETTVDTKLYQQDAIKAVTQFRTGILEAPTGSGKTVMALLLIAARNQKTMVLVHSKELLYQWRDRAVEFLGLQPEQVGLIGDGNKFDASKSLTIAIVNSTYKMNKDKFDGTGFLIVDECHRTPSRTFTDAVSKFKSRYILGLSATPVRRDRMEQVMHLYLGPTRHSIDPKEIELAGMKVVGKVAFKNTGFIMPETESDEEPTFNDIVRELAISEERNRLIANDVRKVLAYQGGTCLILVGTKIHCEELEKKMSYFVQHPAIRNVKVLNGGTSKKNRETTIELLREGKVSVLISTHQLIGEGFDYDGFTSMVMASPISFDGKVRQCVGRLTRFKEGKKVVYLRDYVDNVPMLIAMSAKRESSYMKMGLEV